MRKSVSFLIAVLFMMIWGDSALAAVNLPQDLTIIEESAFENDTSLEGLLAFPDGMLEIRANALTGTNLFALDVPASAAALGEQQLNYAAYVRIRGEQTQISQSLLSSAVSISFPRLADRGSSSWSRNTWPGCLCEGSFRKSTGTVYCSIRVWSR